MTGLLCDYFARELITAFLWFYHSIDGNWLGILEGKAGSGS